MRTKRHMSELATQFEKYRHTMQKEIESLQLKNRKMETTIQSMTLEKETTKSTLLKNNQELASLRQENMLLQKSVFNYIPFIIIIINLLSSYIGGGERTFFFF